jgi:hypothetical protein
MLKGDIEHLFFLEVRRLFNKETKKIWFMKTRLNVRKYLPIMNSDDKK